MTPISAPGADRVVDQATGLLMMRLGADQHQAFRHLRSVAELAGQPVAVVARRLLAEHDRRVGLLASGPPRGPHEG